MKWVLLSAAALVFATAAPAEDKKPAGPITLALVAKSDKYKFDGGGQAPAEFKKALERAPEDFDTKYNHELTQRLIQETKKQPKTPPNQLMQLLRPQPKPGAKPIKRVG